MVENTGKEVQKFASAMADVAEPRTTSYRRSAHIQSQGDIPNFEDITAITPDTYSGVAVVAIEGDSERSSDPSRIPART
jgi:hypothetical protein